MRSKKNLSVGVQWQREELLYHPSRVNHVSFLPRREIRLFLVRKDQNGRRTGGFGLHDRESRESHLVTRASGVGFYFPDNEEAVEDYAFVFLLQILRSHF